MPTESLDQLKAQARDLKQKLAKVEKQVQTEVEKLRVTAEAVLAEAAVDPIYKEQLTKILDKHVRGHHDRAMVGLDQAPGSRLDHTITGD